MKRMIPLVLVAACNFNSASGSGTDAGGDDQPADGSAGQDAATPDGPPADTGPDMCFGTGETKACLVTLPTMDVEWTVDTILDTSAGGPCVPTTNAAAANWCVIAGNRVKVDLDITLRVVGDRPIVLVATGPLEIAGALDVSSRTSSVGAGGDPAICGAGTAASSGNSAGGGFGGSFGGRGGNGGSNDGGVGGIAPAIVTNNVLLRGGCPGGASGMINNVRASGGHGGGAVALISRTQLQLATTYINASGSGGRVADTAKLGGGGGGSGGMIVLDAPIILAGNAQIFADGGGGAEGNGSNMGQFGWETVNAGYGAIGGFGLSPGGGDGGDGSAGADGHAAVANASVNGGGGGGGGGGTGVIIATKPLTGAVASPPAS